MAAAPSPPFSKKSNMTIKGENLRLFLNNMCVGAATSCNVHCVLLVGESDTKDDVEDWIIQEPQGHSWDTQVDAMVDERPRLHGVAKCTEYLGSGYGYRAPQGFTLQKGDGIQVQSDNESDTVHILTLTSQGYMEQSSGVGRAQYEAVSDSEIYVSSSRENANLTYWIGDVQSVSMINLAGALVNGLEVLVKFSTTAPGSNRNRTEVKTILQGYAVISDLNITAQNEDISVYTCKLTGTGPLEIVE